MIKNLGKNALWLGLFAILSLFYLTKVIDYIPREYLLTINIVLFTALGIILFFAYEGPIWLKLLFALALPVIHIIYIGDDPAKPGLGRVAMYIEMFFIALGLVVAQFTFNRFTGPR